ncbi:MAG: winged helix-turn-helix domain-containing protein [Woeseia sp.]|nr:winged helix-turn-helix domain-containing protein [Woeseia sp.]
MVAKYGSVVELTTAEFYLLRALTKSSNQFLSRDFLLDEVHNADWYGSDRGVDSLVSRVRKKLKQPVRTAPLIKAVRGAGYMFTPNVRER